MEPTSDLQTLYDFLISVLPHALVLKAVGYATVVAALVGLARKVPWVEARRKVAAPLIGLVLGQVFGFATVGFNAAQLPVGIGLGVVITLSAIGGVSAVKNMAQALSAQEGSKAEPAKTA